MTLSDELTWRGFINQTTFTDIAQINEPRTFYFGVDPSADSMQIGNLAAAMMVRQFIDHGHKAVLLVGGATGMIGDPDGKKQERDLKTPEEIARNKAAIIRQYETIFAGKQFEVVDNYEWFSEINYLQFLRDIGKHVSMTQLLDRDFIQSRIGEGGAGISYAEFSYSLIQGYDFLHLYRTKGVTLQLAGADQWGNTITGVSLLRKLEGVEAHVFTTPLIVNKQTGVKFGKSEGGAVWLDGEKTSPYKFYQFWLNINDEMARDLVKIYTLLPRDNIETLIREHDENPGQRLLQRTIAHEVTQLVHGEARTAAVQRATELLFGSGVTEVLDDAVADELAGEIPVASVGQSVIETLAQAGICSGKGEARRLLAAGAISMNGSKLQEDQMIGQPAVVKKGKNTFLLVR